MRMLLLRCIGMVEVLGRVGRRDRCVGQWWFPCLERKAGAGVGGVGNVCVCGKYDQNGFETTLSCVSFLLFHLCAFSFGLKLWQFECCWCDGSAHGEQEGRTSIVHEVADEECK